MIVGNINQCLLHVNLTNFYALSNVCIGPKYAINMLLVGPAKMSGAYHIYKTFLTTDKAFVLFFRE
jgi:hypothetical protein